MNMRWFRWTYLRWVGEGAGRPGNPRNWGLPCKGDTAALGERRPSLHKSWHDFAGWCSHCIRPKEGVLGPWLSGSPMFSSYTP